MKYVRLAILAIAFAVIGSCMMNGNDDSVEWLFDGSVEVTMEETDDEEEDAFSCEVKDPATQYVEI